jgi:hypothetical protein
MRRLVLCLVPILTFAAACSDSRSPSAPSPTPGNAASISGVVSSGGSGSNQFAADSSGAGMKVSVSGTNLQTFADATGRFALQNVPSGDVRLQFSSSSVDAGVDVSNVQQREAIELNVVVTSTSAVVESQRRSTGSDTELEGRIEKLPPESAPNTLVVTGVTVLTNSSTKYFLNGEPADVDDLAIGLRVHVKGQSNGTGILALVIQIQNTNPDIPVEINGIVDEFTGTSSQFQFEIDGRLIKGDANTEFFGNSAFSDLDDGVRAEVKGKQRNGHVYAERIHVNTEELPPGPSNTSASIEGLLTSINLPLLVVDGVTVRTSASTTVRRGGDDSQPLTALDLNMIVHVVGDRQSDGSLDARMIQIKGDAVGGKFQITGSMGGVKGTCTTSLSFGINGYEIVTDSATQYDPVGSCSSLKSGSKVTVFGIVQAGGVVKATKVERQ